MSNKLKQLKAQRDLWQQRLAALEKSARRALEDKNHLDMFKIRFSDIANIHDEFLLSHNSVLGILSVTDNSDLEAEEAILTEFDDSFYTIKSIYHTLFKTEQQVPIIASNKPNVRLPKIDVPKFDGNIKEWPTFIDLFSALVHTNGSLSNAEKFHFLLSSLSKNALSIVKTIPLTNDNYPIAFNALTKRYQNPRLLASAYWREITAAPILKSESASGLRNLLECFTENLEALKHLNLPVDSWSFVLFHLLASKLDQQTVTRFELQHASTNIPSYEELVGFLVKLCTALESASSTVGSKNTREFNSTKGQYFRSPKPEQKPNSSCFINAINNKTKCVLCTSSHPLYRCSSFLTKSPVDRFNFVKQKNLCVNCLQSTHRTSSCASQSSCRTCQSKHHSLLHFTHSNPVTPSSSAEPTSYHISQISTIPTSTSSSTVSADSLPSTSSTISLPVNSLTNVVPRNTTVLLSTALVDILDARGNFQTIRALLDSASQASFITERCCNRLGLTRSRLALSILGLGGMSSKTSGSITSTLRPTGKLSPNLTVDAIILPKICGTMPSKYIPNDNFENISNIKLADPKFNIPSDVDLLLGADIFPLILASGHIAAGNENQPTAINTIFGWILMGKVSSFPGKCLSSFHSSVEFSLDETIKRFWEIEEVPRANIASPEDRLCEHSFIENYSRDRSGRYTVALPFKGLEPTFFDSRTVAQRRFHSLEKRLLQNSSLYELYSEFMTDYLKSGHMEEISSSIATNSSEKIYYIPHHSVIKPDSITTKLRVVFDASCKCSNGISLNDTLLKGPKLQKDIITILLNFRLHNYVFTADIKQMYRQILIQPNHRDYQRILWRFSPNDPIKDFRLKTVTYGISSAPFLALRTLHQLAQDEKQHFDRATEILLSDVYVDDLVTGCSSLEEALTLQNDLISLLAKGGFALRKWTSNHPLLLKDIPNEHRYQQALSFEDEENVGIKILGLKWLPSNDSFSYNVETLDRPCTKRTVLSELARIYDPLGFLTPLSFFAKHIVQYLWSLGLEWDQTPPPDVLSRWNQYKRELPILSSYHIPRHIKPYHYLSCDLHGFCDSSEKGYAAVTYVRFVSQDDKIGIFFICAKSKVAPLKRISLPRLELCAAVLLSNLIAFVVKIYAEKLHFNNIFAWSDSSVVLSWIRSSPHRWKTFVSNRISHIQERVSPASWHHIRSSENPADCASRGLMPQDLLNHPLWWAGPPWLQRPSDLWPAANLIDNSCVPSEEERKVVLSTWVHSETCSILLARFSSLSKIKRIIAYCLRFYHNLKHSEHKKTGSLSIFELHQALILLIKDTQNTIFMEDIGHIQRGKQISKPLRKLTPFLDEDGILRVGGRLVNANLSFDQKHPILLARDHRLTNLIIEETHRDNCHPGLQTLLYLLSQNFWILNPKRAIRSVLSNCYKCFRTKPKPVMPVMGNLPPLRISQLKPFSCVGVDFGGPFSITLGKTRGGKTQKAYLCLFVCFSTKALHLELASSLSSEAFLAAFRRFIARRGRCSYIYSDCGTNFVGASKYIFQLMKTAAEEENIKWHFNPPSAPHFGGLWEAGIKSVKSHLLRVVGQQILTFEELSTVFTQIEALLNSRPICPISSDPNDLKALTPGHFLTLEPLTALPDEDVTGVQLNRLTRWQLLQRIHQDFWKRWHQEYLHTLMQRYKWNKTEISSLQPGALVLIKEDNLPPLKWRLGRIEIIHPGSDGVARVATLRVGKGSLQRPMVKLCPLPNQQQ